MADDKYLRENVIAPFEAAKADNNDIDGTQSIYTKPSKENGNPPKGLVNKFADPK